MQQLEPKKTVTMQRAVPGVEIGGSSASTADLSIQRFAGVIIRPDRYLQAGSVKKTIERIKGFNKHIFGGQ